MRFTPFRTGNPDDAIATSYTGTNEELFRVLGIDIDMAHSMRLSLTGRQVTALVKRWVKEFGTSGPTHEWPSVEEHYSITSDHADKFAVHQTVLALLGIPTTWPVVQLMLKIEAGEITTLELELEMHATNSQVDPETSHEIVPLITTKL